MKALALSLVLGLLSLGTSASQPSDLTQYWNSKYDIISKITKQEGIPNKGVKTQYGTVYTKLTNICQEAGMLKTINPVRMCAKWGYKQVKCDRGNGTCYDKDERVCVAYAKVDGASPIVGSRKVCAKKSDKEARAWRLANGRDKKFNTDYPNCSVFKTISLKSVTSYDFLIIKKFGYASDADERRYGGALVDEVNYTIPQCSSVK